MVEGWEEKGIGICQIWSLVIVRTFYPLDQLCLPFLQKASSTITKYHRIRRRQEVNENTSVTFMVGGSSSVESIKLVGPAASVRGSATHPAVPLICPSREEELSLIHRWISTLVLNGAFLGIPKLAVLILSIPRYLPPSQHLFPPRPHDGHTGPRSRN